MSQPATIQPPDLDIKRRNGARDTPPIIDAGEITTEPSASTGGSNEVTEAQTLAAQLLALGRTGRSVAGELGIREETVSRWKQRPAFQAQVNLYVKQIEEVVLNRYRALSGVALNVIEQALRSDAIPLVERARLAERFIGQRRLGEAATEPLPVEPEQVKEMEVARLRGFRATVLRDWN